MVGAARICPVCGSEHVVEKDNGYFCKACGLSFEKGKTSNEDEQRKFIRQVDAESDLKMSPPHFEDALAKYEQLLKDYPEWSVPYWGYVRAKYGIKYENDLNDKTVPCCYEGEYKDFRNDKYYKKALQLAESSDLKSKYESEADRIARTWKEWEDKARKFNYDIFLSFKATDENGNETKDQKEMRNLYTYLVEQGYKVFFSPVSMKEHAGEPYYDAYIYNALEKAKVLILYGTKSEYFETTWVRNEWERFFKQISEGKKEIRSLLVIYEGFNPSDELPKKLASRQLINGESKNLYTEVSTLVSEIIATSKKKEAIEHITVEQVQQGKKVNKQPGVKLVTIGNEKIEKKELGKEMEVHSKELTNEGSGLYTPTIKDRLKTGRTCLIAGRYDEALAFFDECLKEDNGNGQAWIGYFASKIANKDIYLFLTGERKDCVKLLSNIVIQFSSYKETIKNLVEFADDKDAAERALSMVYSSFFVDAIIAKNKAVYLDAYNFLSEYNSVYRVKARDYLSNHLDEIYQSDNKGFGEVFETLTKGYSNNEFDSFINHLDRVINFYSNNRMYIAAQKWIERKFEYVKADERSMMHSIYYSRSRANIKEYEQSIIDSGNVSETVEIINKHINELTTEDAEKVLNNVAQIIIDLTSTKLTSNPNETSGRTYLITQSKIGVLTNNIAKAVVDLFDAISKYQFTRREEMIRVLRENCELFFSNTERDKLAKFITAVLLESKVDVDTHINDLIKAGNSFGIREYTYAMEMFNRVYEYQENNFFASSNIFLLNLRYGVDKREGLVTKENLENILKYAPNEEEQQEFLKRILNVLSDDIRRYRDPKKECESLKDYELVIKYVNEDQADLLASLGLLCLENQWIDKSVTQKYIEMSSAIKSHGNTKARYALLLLKLNCNTTDELMKCRAFSKDLPEFKELLLSCGDNEEELLKYAKLGDDILANLKRIDDEQKRRVERAEAERKSLEAERFELLLKIIFHLLSVAAVGCAIASVVIQTINDFVTTSRPVAFPILIIGLLIVIGLEINVQVKLIKDGEFDHFVGFRVGQLVLFAIGFFIMLAVDTNVKGMNNTFSSISLLLLGPSFVVHLLTTIFGNMWLY